MAVVTRDFYLVWNPESFPPKFRHATRQGATREAERLAEKVKGAEFFVLHAVSVSRTPKPVETTRLDGDDDASDGIPF